MPFDARRVSALALFLLCTTVPLGAADDLPAGSLAGTWSGALNVGGPQLRLVVKIKADQQGRLTATLDSPDQGARDIPLEDVQMKDGAVEFKMPIARAGFSGRMTADGSQLVGTWSQSGRTLPLTLKRDANGAAALASEPRRPQEPKRPYPYVEEEVSYPNPAAGITLAGTLTRPEKGGSFPTLLLLSGSGPQTRDARVMGHGLFLVLADQLTRAGIAVLRVDDRGVGRSTGDFAKATTEDFASDALAGVEFLKTRKDIDPRRIGLYGHSEGGLVAPLVARSSPDVAFVVLVAAPGVPLETILVRQGELIARAGGVSDAAIARNRALQEQLFAVLKEEPDTARAESKLRDVLKLFRQDDAEGAAAVEGQITTLLSPWFRFALSFDPRPVLRKVQCPVLALIGEKDLQVPRENLELVRAALEEGGNKRVRAVQLPGLNHLLQTSKTGSPAEYQEIEETIAPKAVKIIQEWVLALR
jgi:pimeloyl-ACP methyl ester carboxylesterase